MMDHDLVDDTYILLLLSDSNLPTGSFVASSGLESYLKHGFGFPGRVDGGGARNKTETATTFMRESISAYARNALPFVSDAHRFAERYRSGSLSEKGLIEGEEPIGEDRENDTKEQMEGEDKKLECSEKECLEKLKELDELYDAMTLNHVTKRASKSQGVALLTLYSKGFSYPPSFSPAQNQETQKDLDVDSKMASLVTKYKAFVRAESAPGNLSICWGILTAALGLTLERSQYLHIFLHARSLLSASVRLNEIGPYNAQQILLHVAQPVIKAEVNRCGDLRTGVGLEQEHGDFDETVQGPANTWPLGELLAARHDQQHSRIFNS